MAPLKARKNALPKAKRSPPPAPSTLSSGQTLLATAMRGMNAFRPSVPVGSSICPPRRNWRRAGGTCWPSSLSSGAAVCHNATSWIIIQIC